MNGRSAKLAAALRFNQVEVPAMKKHDSQNNPPGGSGDFGSAPASSLCGALVWDRDSADDGSPPAWLTRAQWLRLSDEIELSLEELEVDYAGFVTLNSRLGKQRRSQGQS